ncbi:MAG: hypothetical protein CMB80_05925 [Flammeovirgaceae bacterium]|nr:hypothetical protein [Flammeovirgaceae bacterium]MBE62706.1 hypothetical protein [Flammeovirgaceae bacterium]MBR10942.1 hypothetical protein [Rickettsiales bacterium]HCX20466.1 hypothetical protein [Cytophagales bacterium]
MTINCNAVADRSVTSSPKLYLKTLILLLLLHLGLVAAAQDDTYEGGDLEEVTVTEEEARSLIHQLLDVKRFTHSFGVGRIAKDERLIAFAEGFVERNEIEVLTIGYIDSEEFWPRIFKNIRLKKIDKANTDLLLTGHIMFIPVTDADGSITAYTVELKLEGKTTEVYDLLEISQDDVELIAQETTTEQLGNTEFQTPQEAQDKVVNAMLAALQKVEQTSDPEAATGKLVTFEAASDQTYGFDAPSRQELNADYPSITVNGSTVLTSWKSLKSGMQDKVIALDSSGQAVTFEYDNVPVTAAINQDSSAYNLSINGSSDGTEGGLVAKVGQTIVGKLNTITYDISDVKVKVVPVNGAGSGVTQVALQNELNKIYAPAIATWQVEVLANQELGTAWDDQGNGLEDGETGMLSNYTEEMNDLIKAFKDKNDRDKDAYYVFLVDRAENASKLGYMPRKKQWGFIFTNGQSTETITTTIAHELGHGVYRLEHTFAEKGIPQGQTQNLMDYAGGRQLYKYQWDYVHNPTSVITLFDDEEEAASEVKYSEVNFGEGVDISAYFSNEVSYITPGGSIISLSTSAKPSFTGIVNVPGIDQTLYKGVLMGFKENQKRWIARFGQIGEEYKFKGYVELGTDNYYPTNDSSQQLTKDVLIGTEQHNNCTIALYKASYSGKSYSNNLAVLFSNYSGTKELIQDNIALKEGSCETQYLTNIVFASNMTWDQGSRGFTGSITIDSLKTNTSTPDLKSLKGKNILVADYVGLGGRSIGLKSDSPIGSIFLKLATTIKVCITNEKTDVAIIDGLKARESVDEFGKFIALESNEMLLWVHFTNDNKSNVIFWFPSSARKEVREYLKEHSPVGIAALGVAEAGVVIKGLGDMVSEALDSLKIPEVYWNPAKPGYKNYMPYVAAVAFPGVESIAKLSYESLTGSPGSETLSQRKFALACGIVNGVITEAQGVALIASMAGQIMSDPNFRAELNESLSNASFSKVYDAVKESAISHLSTLSDLSCVSAELLGRDMVVVATFFIGVGEAVAAVKGAKAASEVFSALAKVAKANAQNYARMLVQFSKFPRTAIKFAQSGTKKFLRRQSDYVLLATLDETTGLTVNKWGYAKHNADGSFVKESGEMLDADGNTVFLTENAEGKAVFCDKYGACFVKGTLIATALGLMPIESISSGDLVWSFDEITQREELREVTQTFVKHSNQIVTIYAGNEIIKTTPEHPFYSNDGWLRAAQITKGTILKVLDQKTDYEEQAALSGHTVLLKNRLARSTLTVDSVSVEEKSSTVYNFSVADFHTYYVGPSKVLVHNSCLPDNLKGIYDQLTPNVKQQLSKLDGDDLQTILGDIAKENPKLTTTFFNDNPDAIIAWDIIKSDALLREELVNLEKLGKFLKETEMEKSKLISSFSNSKNPQKWIDMKIPEADLENIYYGFKSDPPFDLDPWTPEHKAERWAQYKIEKGSDALEYNSWSNVYDGNIDKAVSATRGVNDYFSSLGWGKREITIGNFTDGSKRRLDIADEARSKGVEFKEYSEGKVYASEMIRKEVELDAILVNDRFWELEWVFKNCEPSGPLRKLLEDAGITIKLITE